MKMESGSENCRFRFERGLTAMLAGDTEKALADFESCLKIDADFVPALTSRAFILSRRQRYRQALRDMTRALSLRPDHEGNWHNRAVVYTALGRTREAIGDYQRALRINPNSAGTLNNLAWILATTPDSSLRDGPKAVEYARRSLQIGYIGAWLDTLAAALAESGEFDEAISVEEKAYAMSKFKNESFRCRIEVYRQRLTYSKWREQRSELTIANPR
ncbi:MAG: tetratricopeptide repeat protein [Deltaproteobacteria bacterium]|nr:tetratricopeptide repeat protein [Deltaproteobacteria bacterium]